MKGFQAVVVFYVFLGISYAYANDGAWNNPNGGDWTTNGNWTGNFPNSADAIAGFVGLPTAANQTITSTADITLGSLVLDTTQKLTIALGHNLTFSNSGGNAQIFISGTAVGVNPVISTPLILDSSLDVFINDQRQASISGAISGNGGLNLFGSVNVSAVDILSLSGANSYAGGTAVNTGILGLSGPNNTTVIPGDITVAANAAVQHGRNNQYASATHMTVLGGSVDLNGTTQTMNSLTIAHDGFFSGNGTLDLLASPGNFALILGDNAQLSPALINLINGGGISYDPSFAPNGTAFIPGTTTIDLEGFSVDFHVPHNFFNCIDLDIGDTTLQNGTLNKTGDGKVLFEGGTVPTFNINDGTVIIGDQVGPEVVTATGVVTINSPGVLAGFQTLDAQAGVVNSGTIRPGDACNGCNTTGTLTISGAHEQTISGTLEIKALNTTTSDLLVIDAGTVTLNGELNFQALPGAVFHAGDQIVVVQNTNEETPISGTFSSFVYNLPPCLEATVVYEANQVLVQISNCPCVATPPSPPSNFKAVIRKCDGQCKCLLKATWTASPSLDVVAYRIYKNGILVATVQATDPLVYTAHACSVNGYRIVAVNPENVESTPVWLVRA
jgi:autotransporter-associated beta strand protein